MIEILPNIYSTKTLSRKDPFYEISFGLYYAGEDVCDMTIAGISISIFYFKPVYFGLVKNENRDCESDPLQVMAGVVEVIERTEFSLGTNARRDENSPCVGRDEDKYITHYVDDRPELEARMSAISVCVNTDLSFDKLQKVVEHYFQSHIKKNGLTFHESEHFHKFMTGIRKSFFKKQHEESEA